MEGDDGELLGSYAPTGSGSFAVQEERVDLDDGRTIATIRPSPTAGMSAPIVYPILTDQLGAPRKTLDPSGGAVIWLWDSKEAYGYQSPNEDPGSTGSVFHLNARMPGQELDAETGFFHNGFRDYDPASGRYVESDPLGLAAGWNTYAYVGGDPVMRRDPFGLAYYDKTWGLEDYLFGFTFWERQKAGMDTSMPQGFVDFVAGAGDTASFGLTKHIRKLNNTDSVNSCSKEYTEGRFVGIPLAAGTVAAGGMAINIGIRATGGTATLYHFTSSAAAANIAADGFINASTTGLYGPGVYATAINFRIWASLSGAASVEAALIVDGAGALTTPWPGTFRLLSVAVLP
jgi:RHS repeat-associated protein